jgi:hypothetical protein
MAHAGSISQSLAAAWGVLGCHFRQIWGSSSKSPKTQEIWSYTQSFENPMAWPKGFKVGCLKSCWQNSLSACNGAKMFSRGFRLQLAGWKKQELTFVSALTRKAFEDPVHQTYLGPVGLPFLSACRPSCIQGTNSEPPLPRTCNQSSVMMPLAGVFRTALSCKVMESACNTDRQRTKGV